MLTNTTRKLNEIFEKQSDKKKGMDSWARLELAFQLNKEVQNENSLS